LIERKINTPQEEIMKLFYGKFILLLLIIVAGFAYGQNSDYNLPPGYTLMPGKAVIDLSFKLDGKKLEKEISPNELKFLKEIDDSELHLTSPQYQQYIQEGKAFINSMSAKVKSIYSTDELWYIYAFDQELKEKLAKIH